MSWTCAVLCLYIFLGGVTRSSRPTAVWRKMYEDPTPFPVTIIYTMQLQNRPFTRDDRQPSPRRLDRLLSIQSSLVFTLRLRRHGEPSPDPLSNLRDDFEVNGCLETVRLFNLMISYFFFFFYVLNINILHFAQPLAVTTRVPLWGDVCPVHLGACFVKCFQENEDQNFVL